jgi:hypothetical protein
MTAPANPISGPAPRRRARAAIAEAALWLWLAGTLAGYLYQFHRVLADFATQIGGR